MFSFLNALYIIPILTFLIFVHELGHFITARRAGMKVEEFGFGLPPRLWGKQHGETIYSINAIPLGGFVRVLGEDGKDFQPRSMQAKSARQRALFFGAGSLMNFATAFVLIGVLLLLQGEPSSNTYIVDVVNDSPAQEAGWQPGDRILEVDGRSVSSTTEVVHITNQNSGEPMSVVLGRNGERVETTIVPRENPPEGEGRTGIRLSSALNSNIEVTDVPQGTPAAEAGLQAGDTIVEVNGERITDYLVYDIALRNNAGDTVEIVVRRAGELVTLQAPVPDNPPEDQEPLGANLLQDIQYDRTSLLTVVPDTIREFANTMQRMGEGLLMLIRGEVPLSGVAGPIGMGQLTSEIISQSAVPAWVALINLTILLSLNLAILNLLPLPALDGGRLVFVVVEILRRGKRVAPEKEGLVHFVGLVVLLTFMFAIAFVDIDRIISGNSLVQ